MMSRETFSLLTFSVLAILAVNGSYQWMESHRALDSRQALLQAEKIVSGLNATSAKTLRLAKVIPPQNNQAAWRFEYSRPQGKSLTVTVKENGRASLL